MEVPNKVNDDLAAALFYILGESVPHPVSLEKEAMLLRDKIVVREKLYLKVVELCKPQETPKQMYLTEKAYSWLGKKYYEKAIYYANEYLHTQGWSELPYGTKKEDGIEINYGAALRASVLVDLAKAQQGIGHFDSALFNFMEAYRLEPYSAMDAIKVADVIMKLHGREDALLFLEQQKKSRFYIPLKYTDSQGNTRYNDVYKRLLDAHVFKLKDSIPSGKALF